MVQPDAMKLLVSAPVRHGYQHCGGFSTVLHVVVMGTEFAVVLKPKHLGEGMVKMARSSTTTEGPGTRK